MYPEEGYPPQTNLLQRLALSLTTGMLPTEHVMPVLGLNTSADLRPDTWEREDDDEIPIPPTIKIPEIRNMNKKLTVLDDDVFRNIFCFYLNFISPDAEVFLLD